ncbi:hypothetical protein BKA70DRAFT_1225948 [Coprinopsis sp. MPI-PUGE-AT-0042]|nr:hypothetical protein BKA70DRAFT_1225948 [Coprinopsis sp. MPI-PUGE-AT-0042]
MQSSLDPTFSGHQSAIYYLSSRLRAILIHYVQSFPSLSKDGLLEQFTERLMKEYTFGTKIVGNAIACWGSQFDLPPMFKHCAILILDRQLLDRRLVNLATTEALSGPDALLLHYEGNWWDHFPQNTSLQADSLESFLAVFEQQRHLLNIPRVLTAPSTSFSLESVTTTSLQAALSAAEDILRHIDESIKRSKARTGDIEARLVHVRTQKSRVSNSS